MELQLEFWISAILIVLGLRGIVSKVAATSAGAFPTMVIGYCLAPFAAGAQLFMEGGQVLAAVPVTAVTWVALHALSSLAAGAGQLVAAKRLEASVVVSVTASSVLVTQLLATVLGESLEPQRIFGSLVIIAGVVALKYSRREADKQAKQMSAGAIAALVVSFICMGISPVLQKHATNFAPKEALMVTRSLCDSAVLLVLLPLALSNQKIRSHLRNGRVWLTSLIMAVMGMSATMGTYVALSMSSASHVTALTQTFPVLTYVLAIIFLKEEFSRVRLAGIFAIIAGGAAVR